MSAFIIDVPVPSMGATVSELTVIEVVVAAGATVTKGQKLAELESDKSSFDFESPTDGIIIEVKGAKDDVKKSGDAFFRMETSDESLQHLAVAPGQGLPASGSPTQEAPAAKALVWTPRALKMAQEAGLDPATVTGIEATGPGGRVSGDDVAKYLAGRK